MHNKTFSATFYINFGEQTGVLGKTKINFDDLIDCYKKNKNIIVIDEYGNRYSLAYSNNSDEFYSFVFNGTADILIFNCDKSSKTVYYEFQANGGGSSSSTKLTKIIDFVFTQEEAEHTFELETPTSFDKFIILCGIRGSANNTTTRHAYFKFNNVDDFLWLSNVITSNNSVDVKCNVEFTPDNVISFITKNIYALGTDISYPHNDIQGKSDVYTFIGSHANSEIYYNSITFSTQNSGGVFGVNSWVKVYGVSSQSGVEVG